MAHLHPGAFAKTTRSAGLCLVIALKSASNEVRVCQLTDHQVFNLPLNHAIAEDSPAECFREHVRTVVTEAVNRGVISKDRFDDFSEYLSQYLVHAQENKLTHRVSAALSFLIIAILEGESDSIWSTYQTFWLDVCWFCSQLDLDHPTESLVKSRVVEFKKYIASALTLGEGSDGEEDDIS